jgi:hypothetical protein
MPKFCSECGASVPDENMKFCSECGKPIGSSSIQRQEIKVESGPLSTTIEKKTVTETSRLSGLKIEKYLIPNEIVNYTTKGSLYVGGEANLKGYVTNNRVMFFKSTGLIIKDDRLHEIALKDISQFKIVETGLIIKEMYLQLNNLKIKGERSDILDLYKAIQVAKHGAR